MQPVHLNGREKVITMACNNPDSKSDIDVAHMMSIPMPAALSSISSNKRACMFSVFDVSKQYIAGRKRRLLAGK